MVDLATRIVNVQPRIVTICSCPQMWNHGLRPFGEDCSNRVICISHSAFVPIFMLIYVLAFPNHRADYIRTTWKYSGRFRSIFKARRPRKKNKQLTVVQRVKKRVKLAHFIYRHLQSWTAALYNLGSDSWLALTVVPRRRQWQPRARANGLLGPQLQPTGILRPSQPR